MEKAIFITFEGGEGSGKSTQIKEAADYLKKLGKKVEVYREPGATQVGEAIRNVILNPKLSRMTAETELLLFLAARAQLMREKIVPALKKGKIVLLDRFEDSTLAYQGYGRGVDIKKIASFFSFVRGNIVPDLTFFLDVPVALGMDRAAKRGKADRMEKAKRDFHERVRKGFLTLASKNPNRIKVIDSSATISVVREKILEQLDYVTCK